MIQKKHFLTYDKNHGLNQTPQHTHYQIQPPLEHKPVGNRKHVEILWEHVKLYDFRGICGSPLRLPSVGYHHHFRVRQPGMIINYMQESLHEHTIMAVGEVITA